MSQETIDKFDAWLRQKLHQVLSDSNPAAPLDARHGWLNQAYASFFEVHEHLVGRRRGMLWGAILAPYADELRPRLEGLVGATRDALADELTQLVMTLMGSDTRTAVAPTRPSGFFARLFSSQAKKAKSANVMPFASRRYDGLAPDPAKAAQLLESTANSLKFLWFDHADRSVRLAVARSMRVDDATRATLEARLASETDEGVVAPFAVALGRSGAATSAPILRQKLEYTWSPEVRAELLTALVRCAPDEFDRVIATADAVARLALARSLEGDALLRLVSDGDDGVALAAIGRATTCPPARCVPALGARVMTGPLHVRSAALDALAQTVDRVPHLALSSLLEVATRAEDPLLGRAHSVLTDVVRTKRLTRAHVDLLVEALPRLLPNSDTVAAIRERAEYFSPTVRPSATTHGPLEEAVERQLDHEQAWLVLGDAWQAAGDVRGELVALAHAGRDPVPLVREHASTLLGDAARYLGPELDAFLASVVWRHGLPQSAVARLSYDHLNDVSMPQLVAAVVGAPISRFLTGLQVGLTSFEAEENDYEPVLAALRDTGRAHLLRDLVLGEFTYPDDTEISWAPWGNLASLWSLTPQLERLHVRGAGGDFGDIDAPSLRSLTVETGGLGQHEFNQLASSHAPVLEELELWLGDQNYGAECDTDDVVRLIKRGHSALRRLALKNTYLASSLIEPLAKAPLTVGLRALDLSMSTLGDEHVDLLVRHAPAFAHLDQFNLSENYFSPAAEREIRSVLPNAVFDDQRRANPGERYVAVGE